MQTLLGVLGIIFALVGSLILVIAAVWVPSFMQMPEFQHGHKQRVADTRKWMKTGWGNFTQAERDAAYAKADAEYEESMDQLEKDIAKAFWHDRRRLVRTSGWGALCIGIGSALQGFAAFVG